MNQMILIQKNNENETSNGPFTIKNLMTSSDETVGSLTQIQSSKDVPQPREKWVSKYDFLMSIIGFAVDLANVWRFPYICFKNGGGAFLIPYFAMLVFGAVPLFYMELILGQFHQKGAIGIWKICPLFQGVGVAQNMISFIVALYYNVINGWCFYFLFKSFTYSLPWMTCHPNISTSHCINMEDYLMKNYSRNSSGAVNYSISSLEYFERVVLQVHKSSGIGDLGLPRWELVSCTLGVFVILYITIRRGIKSSGKVVYVTVLLPYVLLIVLLINGLMLPGAKNGIVRFITPNFSILAHTEVWIEAAVQIFYSVGAGFGVHLAYASYNRLNNKCFRDCVATVIVNSGTSLLAGFVVFSYLGYISYLLKDDIDNVVTHGPSLVFQIYPFAIATIRGSSFWSIMFFLLLINLGLDSAMGGIESVVTGLHDVIPIHWKIIKRRDVLSLIVLIFAFLGSIPVVTNGGIYVFTLLDRHAAGTSLLFGALMQAIGVAWFYGLNQFCSDCKQMLGYSPSIFWRICWKFLAPSFILAIVICSTVSMTRLSYPFGCFHPELNMKEYEFPSWSVIIGWGISLSSMIMIPIFAIWNWIHYKNFYKAITPIWEQDQKFERYKRKRLAHWISMGPCDVWPLKEFQQIMYRKKTEMINETTSSSDNICVDERAL
uniref:Transporter n=1 Tax=Schmidtea mediterranea TaxID=79327 RepID=A0A0H3YF51_SCHMD|nr:slc6a-7 [Schmidtea mediterranea]